MSGASSKLELVGFAINQHLKQAERRIESQVEGLNGIRATPGFSSREGQEKAVSAGINLAAAHEARDIHYSIMKAVMAPLDAGETEDDRFQMLFMNEAIELSRAVLNAGNSFSRFDNWKAEWRMQALAKNVEAFTEVARKR
jgi:hypothetical protein